MIIKKILVLSCLVFISLSSRSQTPDNKIDSLKGLLMGSTGLNRVDILYELSFNCIEIDNNSALKYGSEGYDLALRLGDSLKIVKAGLVAASALRRLQKIDSSLSVYITIRAIAEKKNYQDELALLLNSMAISYSYKAQYDKALDCYFQSLRIREASPDAGSKMVVLTNIGLVYYKLKDYEKALEIFLQCYKKDSKDGEYKDDQQLLINIGHCYAYVGDFSSAAIYIDRALQYCGRDCPPKRTMEASFARGVIAVGQKDFNLAEKHFLRSYSIAEASNDVRIQLDNIDYLAQLYIKQNRVAYAYQYLREAEDVIKRNASFNLERIKIYSRFSELYLKTSNFQKASEYQLRYTQLKDSIYSEEMTRNLMRAEASFLERENSARISSQNQIIKLKEEIIRHERTLTRITSLLVLIVIGFLVILWCNYQQKKDQNALLAKKVNDRTRELEVNFHKSQKGFQELDILLDRTSLGITDTTRKIKELCSLGMKDISDPIARSYFRQIDSASGNFEHYLHFNTRGTT